MSLLHPSAAITLSVVLSVLAGCEGVRHVQESDLTGAGKRSATLQLSPQAQPQLSPQAQPAASAEAQPQPAAAAQPAPPPEAQPAPAASAPAFPSGELDPVASPLHGQRAPTSGAPSETCVNGWRTPRRGSALRKAALDMIRARRSERFVIVEMRYFVGPEDAEVLGPQREVERWYVKAHALSQQARAQRWLVRRAAVGRGVDAVAEFDSTGYGPGIWKRPDASDESLSDPFQRPCDRAHAGEKCMGLPREVLGCLQGT